MILTHAHSVLLLLIIFLCRSPSMAAPGVALDDLVYICTKIARQLDSQGVDRVFEAMESAREVIQDAKPLLQRAVELSDEIIPLLIELRAGNLVGNIEALTQVAAEAAADIQRLQTEVLTESNVQALRESVQTLAKTLGHIERITGVCVCARTCGVCVCVVVVGDPSCCSTLSGTDAFLIARR